MKILLSILLFPLTSAWWAFKIIVKLFLTIFLIFLGPFGWGIIAGWWGMGQVQKNRATNEAILAELQQLRAEKR